jgi:hypothetical protein
MICVKEVHAGRNQATGEVTTVTLVAENANATNSCRHYTPGICVQFANWLRKRQKKPCLKKYCKDCDYYRG